MKSLFEKWNSINLVNRIIAGIILGVVFALLLPDQLSVISIFGSLFINALKAVAPILVFILVIHAIASHVGGKATNMKMVVMLYIVGTFVAGFVAVVVSYIFPTTLVLKTSIQEIEPPSGIAEVLEKLLFNMVSNPVSALMDANYLGILTWAVILGFAFKAANDTTKTFISNASDAITKVVQWVISLAPLGIMGLVFETISTTGFDTLSSYGRLIMILVGTMFFIALVINPLLVFIVARRNPYPLVFASLKESGVAAFFTRSSAANIPVNMALAEKLGLNKDTYAISIPLGATINMGGAAVTISILTMAAAHTLGVEVDLLTAVILMILSAVSATGASGVAGGSLLLIPLACSLLGISDDIAMQVVAIGFIIGVIQDSCETALNSSSDVVFTAAAEYANERKVK
ncbi:serine/threonine transporter SstT [Solibacillus sp. FSL K6-1523]|uniref:serine/threonine transporter SstT n=1 Tax=Solibacillus sp. FSL K6-1523 TaxID=2921471 RepID=UPI0030F63466